MARILTHYRVPFHNAVRDRLSEHGVHYDLIYGTPTNAEARKGDLVELPWGISQKTSYVGGLAYLHSKKLRAYDLVIIGQELKNLNNYPLQFMRRITGKPKIAYFGHGKNFQAEGAGGLKERIKFSLVREADWWFGYTEKTREIVQRAGFEPKNITVFNNSIDLNELKSHASSISEQDKFALANTLGVSPNCAIYIGGLYREKRIDFLIEAARVVRSQLHDFTLVIVGGGVDQEIAIRAASEYEWIKYVGPKFGREKALLASLAKVMVLPGLVGLAVLDSFAYGLPLVTTNISWHSPEIDYVKDGVNGLIVPEFESAEAYATAVLDLMQNEDLNARLSLGAAASSAEFSIENMADRFANGVLKALENPRKRPWWRLPN